MHGGRRSDLLKQMVGRKGAWCKKPDHCNVQLLFDSDTAVFQNLWGTDPLGTGHRSSAKVFSASAFLDGDGWFSGPGETFRNPETGSSPAMIHVNGDKADIHELSKKMSTPLSPEQENSTE